MQRITILLAALLLALNAGAQAIIQIASANSVSYFVKSDGSLWRGDYAQHHAKRAQLFQRLQADHKQNPNRPPDKSLIEQIRQENKLKPITSDNLEPVDLIISNGVTTVAMNGQGNLFFVKTDGSLWGMGNNEGGFLGDGTFVTPKHPVQLATGGVVAVACGTAFTIFLKNDGSVWGFGWNDNGPLGDGTKDIDIPTPKKLIGGEVTAIAAGYGHSLFLKRDGSLWGTGNNSCGQLGLGTNVEYVLRPAKIVPSNVTSLTAANGHSLFIKTDGTLWATGLNHWGQLGDCTISWAYHPVPIASNVVAVTAGHSGSLFLKEDGSLWAMGINWSSDYGEGIEFCSRCPAQLRTPNTPTLLAGYYYNAKFKACASLWAGQFNNNPPALNGSLSPTAAVSTATTYYRSPFPATQLITIEQLLDGNVRLTYSGVGGAKYALERTSDLNHPDWVTLHTNTAPAGGLLVITNTPDTTINNFWRIRSTQ